MAAKEATGAGKAKRTTKRPSAGPLLWGMVAVLALGFFALPTFVVIAALLVPTVVAAIVDRSRGRHAVVAVGSLNLAGTVPSVIGLWGAGHTLGAAGRLLADPYAWLGAFGAAGVGWVLVLGLPRVLEVAMTLRNESEIRTLRERQAALVAEWGTEVADVSGGTAEQTAG